VQIDIGFGDVVTPNLEWVSFPVLLDAPAPRLMAYTRYSMVAEKLEAIIRLGMANSRMKDFYDVWVLCGLFDFDGETLSHACRDTLNRRGNRLPATTANSLDSLSNGVPATSEYRP